MSCDQTVYGLRFRGLPYLAELASSDPWEPVGRAITVSLIHNDCRVPALHDIDARRSVRRLPDGRVLELNRESWTASFHGPSPSADQLVHPSLAPVATTFTRWSGREAFHAGAFVVNGHAWAVRGSRTAGKSTLLAALAARGVPVLSDDILATDGRLAFAGPRCIDLRTPLPWGDHPTIRVRDNTRWRVPLAPLPHRFPLGGWIFLGWGSDVAMPAVPTRDLFRRLAVDRAWSDLASDPGILLSLGTLPAWDLQRPRDWCLLEPTLDLLLATVGNVTRQAPTSAELAEVT